MAGAKAAPALEVFQLRAQRRGIGRAQRRQRIEEAVALVGLHLSR
jgi:hypothetical protein